MQTGSGSVKTLHQLANKALRALLLKNVIGQTAVRRQTLTVLQCAISEQTDSPGSTTLQ